MKENKIAATARLSWGFVIASPKPRIVLASEYKPTAPSQKVSKLHGQVLDFRFLFAYSAGGRGNGKRVARRLHCRPGSHESAAAR